MLNHEIKFHDNELLISSDYLMEYYDNDIEDALIMVEMFLNTSAKELSKLKPLYVDGKLEDLRQLVHKIKPTFMMVGLKKITENFKSFEKSIVDEELESIQEMVEHYHKQTAAISKTIETELVRLKRVQKSK